MNKFGFDAFPCGKAGRISNPGRFPLQEIVSLLRYLMGNLCLGMPSDLPAASSHAPSDLESKSKNSSSGFNSSDNGSSVSNFSSHASSAHPPLSLSLKAFTLNDLKAASKNFRPDSFLGEGGFGCVYKGWIDETTLLPSRPGAGIIVAIKKLKQESTQGHKEWLTEVTYLGQLRHENLVKLIGYCSEDEKKLLVYEYMPRGSLENHLFKRGAQPISWATRVNIAVDVARGLAYMHSLEPQVIYRDLKASNILLGGDFNAKLSDFGLARNGPVGDKTHVSTRIIGTRGYAAPEYIATGHLSAKSDVYSFGVVLLELMSGKRALEEERGLEEFLVDWAEPFLSDPRKMVRIMDRRLEGQYMKKTALAMANVAQQCLREDAKLRPSMAEVLVSMVELQATQKSLPGTVVEQNPPRKLCH
ncbi:putative serine/threonine-protein kinase PBL18 [Wolffia australiana]